ncbi:MAG: hypothetical protein EAZ95_11800 [Bacteroidetes bacterium]|nr:MAG: hypothetical protein EAZ95_11800 [Bacteroidota bacterium]
MKKGFATKITTKNPTKTKCTRLWYIFFAFGVGKQNNTENHKLAYPCVCTFSKLKPFAYLCTTFQ